MVLSGCQKLKIQTLDVTIADVRGALIDCRARTKNLSGQLFHEVNDYLLNRTHLRSLTIQNTTLSQIPPGLCRFTKLRYLYLGCNQLTSLPTNCFNGMKLENVRCHAKLTSHNTERSPGFRNLKSSYLLTINRLARNRWAGKLNRTYQFSALWYW